MKQEIGLNYSFEEIQVMNKTRYVSIAKSKIKMVGFRFLKNKIKPKGKHYESGEELWLIGEVALQTHSLRDSDPQPVITQKIKIKLWDIPQVAKTRNKYQADHM